MNQEESTIPPESTFAMAVRQAFSSKPFVIALVIMAVAALGIGASTTFLKLQFRKHPVELRQRLEMIPNRLGPWVQVSTDKPLDAELESTLAATQYVFRNYLDSRLVGQGKIDEILNAPDNEKEHLVAEQEGKMPRAVMHLAVTYYTGMVDTVAHVPDRCYIADGYTPTSYETKKWKVTPGENLEVRFISFEDATGFTSRVNKNVAYFFQVNGRMESDPVRVRFSLQNLFRADVYYAKVELMQTKIASRSECEKTMTDFLSHALPHVRQCLPLEPGSGASPDTAGGTGATTRPVEKTTDKKGLAASADARM